MYFITGATGFLGGHIVCQMLIDKKELVALKRPSSSLKQLEIIADYYTSIGYEIDLNKVQWLQGDLFDEEIIKDTLTKVKTVIHSAGVVSFHPKDAHLLYEVNVEATKNLINYALECGLDYFLHVSSVSTLGAKSHMEINESSMFYEEGKGHYAKSKYLGEVEVHRASAEGLRVGIINPSLIIGAGDWSSGTAHFFKLFGGKFPFYGIGSTGFVTATDVAKAVLWMVNERSTEQFLLSEDNYPFKKIFDVIAEQLGTKKPQIPITIRRAEWAWRLFAVREAITGKRSYFSAENARSAVQDRKFDGQKILKQANSYTYTPVLKEVEKICTYYKTVQIGND